MSDAMSGIRRQLMWNRLISVVEELAQTLIRTAFSTSTREAGDLSAGVFAPDGRMIAQAITGTPGHINSMAASVQHFIRDYPVEGMQPGDVFVTNDPWKASGHLNDFTVVTPAHLDGRVVALFAATVHVADIGGLGVGTEARDVYQEGIYVPIQPLAQRGVINETLMRMIRCNVREPVQVEGDLHSLMVSNQGGVDRLLGMMREFGQTDLMELAEYIFVTSREGMIRAIQALPRGTFHNRMTIDGFDSPVDLVVAATIEDERILIDFDGTSGLSQAGINVPKCYTDAYTSFGVRCVVGPRIPNNAGSLGVVQVVAPEGCIVNAPHPAPVAARHMIGQMLPDAVLGALYQAVPDLVPAEGASCLWNIRVAGGPGTPGLTASQRLNSRRFGITTFNAGGMGARPVSDGLSATSFPAGVRNVPLEIVETMTPLVFWRKEFRENSGGAGKWRGGDGQIIELAHAEDEPFTLNATFERVDNAARGRAGGENGKPGVVRLASGKILKAKGRQAVPAGDRLIVEMPGGGGYGEPEQRGAGMKARDKAYGRG
ncbi:hydantoinase B/oxoprolinase family protein [Ferrovibrio sp.]|uniref:hydantoinase B/oxoprolinase family protein n=1 Tax=Ferrovibrio sp. TaxID=1917215 RepID=UPI0025C03FAF|nr:hydantoinase B/oxoprolinase family protein [Ferrovibrio sp.]MBX3456464.1 hydantoinase B/oxoprolinase family protein [Ferrovibrio sp.]